MDLNTTRMCGTAKCRYSRTITCFFVLINGKFEKQVRSYRQYIFVLIIMHLLHK